MTRETHTFMNCTGGVLLASAVLLATSPPAAAQGAPPPTVTVAQPLVKDVTEYDDYTGRFEGSAPRANGDESDRSDPAWIPTTDGSAQPTVAWSEFCARSPGECAIDPAEPAIIKLDERVWNSISAINKQVNAAVSPREDIEHWGVIDRWDYPDDGYGDCEDYQILKRRLLVQAGLPRRALRMVVVLDELGQGHAVLAAHTDRGDFILDNKKDQVLPWDRTGYVYIKSEGDKSLAWVSLRYQAVTTAGLTEQ